MSKSKISGVRHALGKAKLAWQRWEADGPSRALRYGIGLNGANEGASVILLEVRNVADKEWSFEVWPKNDYGDLLPAKFKQAISGFKKSKEAAKRAAEKVVGLKTKTDKKPKAKPVKRKPSPRILAERRAAALKERHAKQRARERAKAREALKQARARAAKNGNKFLAGYGPMHQVGKPSGSKLPFSSSSIAKTWARSHAQDLAKRYGYKTQWIVWNNKTGFPVSHGTEDYVKPANY